MVTFAKSPQGISRGDIWRTVGWILDFSLYLFFLNAVNPPLLQDQMRSSWERRRLPEEGSPPTDSGNNRTKRKEFFLSKLICYTGNREMTTADSPDPDKTLGSLSCLVARDTQLTHLIQINPSALSPAWWPGTLS
jgi:hypothetical protein